MISDYHINLLLILVVTYFMLFYSYSYSQLLNFPLQCNRDLRCYTNYITINRIFKWLRYWGRHRSVDRSSGAYSGRGGRLGAPPLDFKNLKRKSTVTHPAIEKETKRKNVKEKEEIYRFWSYDGQRTPPPSSLLAISVYPLFSLFL